MNSSKPKWSVRGELPILAAVFFDLLGFGMLIPDVQLRAESYGAPGWLIGVVLASMFIVQIVVSPRWGALSDRVGRKPIIVVCTLISAGAMAVYAVAGSVWLILLSRMLAGLGAANVAVAQGYLADISDEKSRAAAMGRVGAAISLGLIVGPGLGGELATLGGNQLLGFTAAAFSAVGAIWVAFSLEDVRPKEPVQGSPGKIGLIDLRLLREVPGVRALAIVAAVAWFSLAMLEGTYGRLIRHNLGYGAQEFGLINSYEALLGVVVQGLVLAWIASRMRESRLLQMAFVLQGIGLAMTPLAPHLAALFLTSTLFAIGAALAGPTLNSLASRLTPPERQGEMFGLLQSARSFGFIVGPILGGQLFDVSPPAPYFLAGFVCLAAAVFVALPGIVAERQPGPSTST